MIIVILFLIFTSQANLIDPPTHVDEKVYANVTAAWNAYGIQTVKETWANYADNKPITFLYLQKILLADQTTKYTRLLTYIIILTNIRLIYSLTKRWESIFFLLIPIFLNSMWLTVEIIETMFILMALRYKEFSGVFVGIAMIFRPYAILFSILLDRKQLKYVVGVGLIFIIIMMYHGMFWAYLDRTIHYVTIEPKYVEIDYLGALMFGLFAIMGSGSKQCFKWGLMASIPLLNRVWGHYFIDPFTLFFVSYLSKIKKSNITQPQK